MGQYLFITRGGDEYSGGGEVSATVDKFQEGRLDDIMVDIVKNFSCSSGPPFSFSMTCQAFGPWIWKR